MTWHRILAIGGALAMICVALPAGRASAALCVAVIGAAGVTIGAGIGRARVERSGRGDWRFVRAGFALIAAGEFIRLGQAILERDLFPQIPDGALLFLAGHLLVAVGMAAMVRRYSQSANPDTLIDLGLVIVPTVALSWVVLLHPYLDRHDAGAIGRFVATTESALAIIGIALAVRLWFSPARWLAPQRFLIAAVLALSLSTIVWFGYQVPGASEPHRLIDMLRLTAFVLAAAASWRPELSQADPGRRRAEAALSTRRLIVLLFVSLIPPLALIITAAGHKDAFRLDVIFLAGSIIATIFLVVARLWNIARLIGAVAEHRGERRARALLRDSHDIVAIVDASGYVTFANPAMEKVLGYRPSEFIGRHIGVLAAPDTRDSVGLAFTSLCETPPGTALSYELPAQTAQGSIVLLELTGMNKLDDPDVHGVILTGRDITQRRELENQLTFSATHDPLTQLANRTLFFRRLEAGIRYVESDRSHRAAVISIDLDDFKSVNDTCGHAVGDQLLTTVAARLAKCVRADDTVARLGGDEFAILTLYTFTHDHCETMANRILQELRQPFVADDRVMRIAASLGIRRLRGLDNSTEVMHDADTALAEAKSLGKCQVVTFTPELGQRTKRSLLLRNELAGAWSRDEIQVCFQPVVGLRSARTVGAEALLRWTHPVFGPIPPSEFIELAEESDVIHELGAWVLEEACAAVRSWRAHDPTLYVSVNVSPRQLVEPDFVDRVEVMLKRHDLPGDALLVELTEGAFLDEPDRAIAVLEVLRSLGMRCGIDDFGTGYSSLSYLHRLPVDVLKIDRSFVQSGDQPSHALMRTIVALGESLNLTVIAEGVETNEQRWVIEEMGCRFAQGYLFAEPLALADFNHGLPFSVQSYR